METITIPVSELKLLKTATQGVNMPMLAATAVQALIAHIPTTNLKDTLSDLQRLVEEAPERTLEQHLSSMLSTIALLPVTVDKAKALTDLAVVATQWALIANAGDDTYDHDVYREIAKEAEEQYPLESPTMADLAVQVGEIARCLDRGWGGYINLVELAGQAVAMAARERADN